MLDAGFATTLVGMSELDVVIIGGGAAGLSAALVLGRARRRVAVIDAGSPRNAPAARMQGFLGSDGLPPKELLDSGRAEVTGYGVRLITGVANRIAPATGTDGSGFRVRLTDGTELSTRRVLVTTGLRDEIPDLPGVRERWGKDLLHCPYCHGYEVRDRRLAVLGGSPEAVAHALLLRQWSSNVVLFSDAEQLKAVEREQLAARGIAVNDEPVTGLAIDKDRLRGVELASGAVMERDAVFVRPRFVANDNLLTDLGCATHPNGWVVTDPGGATSVTGVWAAGNAVNPRAQVITAAGEGSAAAIAINNDLAEEDTRVAVRDFRLGLTP